MIKGNITEFLDKLYYGGELLFEYQGITYFLQGWPRMAKHQWYSISKTPLLLTAIYGNVLEKP